MQGTLTLYSRKGEIIIRCFYKKSEDRWMLMRTWADTYEALGYYFIISPEVDIEKEKVELVKKEYAKRLPKEEKVVFVRPKAVYDNKSCLGIADELHNNQIARPIWKKKRKRINY